MNASPENLSTLPQIRKRRYYYIVFFIIIAFILLEFVRFSILRSIESDWDSIYIKQASREAALVTGMFSEIQDRVKKVGNITVSSLRSVAAGGGYQDIPESDYFTVIHAIDLDELQGVEVFSRDGKLLAWGGRMITERSDDIVNPDRTEVYSFVTEGSVFTTLTVVIPVCNGHDEPLIYVAAHEAFDVLYTLSPRFIKMQGLHRDIREALGKNAVLIFTGLNNGENMLVVPLTGIDGSLLGSALVNPPLLEAYTAGFEETFRTVRSFLILALSLLFFPALIRRLRAGEFPIHHTILAIAVLWLVRYIWMLLDVPDAIIGGKIFDPAYYASPSGGGILASPGDLFLTAVMFLGSSLLLFHSVVINNGLRLPVHADALKRWFLTVLSFVVMTAFMGLIRSYAASVRSVVFDSSVSFTEPGSLLPSPMLALMQLNLLTVSAGFVIAGTVLGFIILRLLQAGFSSSIYRYGPLLGTVLLGAACVYFFPQSNPLVGLWYYIAVPLVLISVTILVQQGFLQSFSLYKIRSILFLTGMSVLFASPVLNKKIHEHDREQLQFIAANIVHPADAWKDFILRRSLEDFSADERLLSELENANYAALERKAFQLWAGSMLGREGYNSTITIYNKDHDIVSSFGIGFQVQADVPLYLLKELAEEGLIYIEDIETAYGNATLYSGASRITNEHDITAGLVEIKIVTGPGTLFRGFMSDILQTKVSPDIAARYGALIVSEFSGRRLISTSAPDIPSTYTIPERVADKMKRNGASFIWDKERIEGRWYESAYFQDPHRGPDSYIAVSVPLLDFRWHVFYTLKLIFFALSVSGLILVVAGMLFYLRGKRYEPTFKEKILIGMLSIALIPIIIVAYLNRDFTAERMKENISRQLYEETKRVSMRLERLNDYKEGEFSLSSQKAELLASELGIDFIIFRDGVMESTSRLEMFEAELMDRRLSGYAYMNIALRGKNFVMREEAIGQSLYLVGYRPLFGGDSGIEAVLAVPAIYRQEEIVEELARRDAFLFGVYAVVILGIVFTGLIVANRVSRPIENLTEATKKVAGGELEISLESKGNSEISNLMRSFNAMTKRLKESREELARIERELAWREMARQVAHEIKNPLTPMKLSIQQLRQERKDHSRDFDEAFCKVTEMLLGQIDSLDRIASEFSRFARMPASNYEPVNINRIIARTLTVFSKKEGVDFQTKFDDTIPVINADPDEMQRAFVNIIRNSIQAMPEGGRVAIETRFESGAVLITITDTGTGMGPEVRARLFEPYFSTKSDGMGLGLAIVKKIIDELAGKISVSSEENDGTTVVISLPVKT